MKTVNGKNKLERQINKLKKYLNIIVEERSNKYLTITDFDEENTFIFIGTPRYVKDGDLCLIEPINATEPLFFKSWSVYYEKASWYFNYQDFVIFKTWEGNHKKVIELAKGADDVFLLKDFMEGVMKDVYLKKR